MKTWRLATKGKDVELSPQTVNYVSIMCTWHGHANDYSSESLKYGQCERTSCEHPSVDRPLDMLDHYMVV